MTGRYFIGGLLILLGIGFLLDQLFYWNFSYLIGTWWPLIIILFGVIQLSKKGSSIIPGIIIIIIGILLQADEIGYLYGGFWGAFWPLILILLGFLVLSRKFRWGKRNRIVSEDEIDYLALFTGLEQIVESKNFRGGNISAYFGGVDIDMRDVTISPEGCTIDISVMFGGVTLKVPRECIVKTNGMPLFGGIDNKLKYKIQEGNALPVINVKYFVAFGGIEIRD